MARSKKKVTEVVEKVEDVIFPTPKKKVVNKDKTVIETVYSKKKTSKVITEKPMEIVKDEIKPKKIRKTKVDEQIIETPKKNKKTSEPKPIVNINEPTKVQKTSEPKKKTRKNKEEEPKLATIPPSPPKKESKVKVQRVSESRKLKKPIFKVKDFYEFEEGKYVLGDVEELFDEKSLKKMKTSIKKLSKKNHGKDDNLGIHYFKVGDKVWDFIEYNTKILTASNSLILCKSDKITKEGKLRFCKRFEAKEKFKVFVDYTKDDYCLYFWTENEPCPFMMLNDEALI